MWVFNELIELANMYFGIVYLIKNSVNNKIYVGQTTNLKRRIKDYRIRKIYTKSRKYSLMEDIIKYGFENFHFSILDVSDNIHDLYDKEKFWIKKLNSNDPRTGYNKKTGDTGGLLNIESKIKMSDSSKLFKHTEKTKIMKSKPIIVFKDGIFKKYYGAKNFADIFGIDKSIITSALRKGHFIYGYLIFYLDKEGRMKTIISNKKHIGKYLKVAKLLNGKDVETIENYLFVLVYNEWLSCE